MTQQPTVEKLKGGNIRFVIVHPEQAIQDSFKKILMMTAKCIKISHIVIDEAHCVLSWGLSDFRPAYRKIGSLRSLLPDAKVIGLTATATPFSQQEIIKCLNMVNVEIIKESPDRPNVYLDVRRRPASRGGENSAELAIYTVADVLLQELQEKKTTFDKTIMYVPLKWCGLLHERAATKYGVGTLVAQYHAPQSQKMKVHIVSHMEREDSVIRLLLATEACGMGVDIPDIRRIIHITPPSNIETFIQEIGRCGRDGFQSAALLYYNNNDIGANKIHLQEEMRNYITSIGCRRKYLMQYFGFTVSQESSFLCCNNCSEDTYACKQIVSNDRICIHASVSEHRSDVFSSDQKQIAKQLLHAYFTRENKVSCSFLSCLRTGLTEQLEDKLCSKTVYDDIDILRQDFPALNEGFLVNISKIIKSVKDSAISG